jgi:aminoglycoside phosphotransferase (APT) family kinase protein
MEARPVERPSTERDLAAVAEQLGAWFATRLPAGARPQIETLHTPSNTGFSSETLLFDLRWDDRGTSRLEPLVARLKPTEFSVFPRYDLALQFWVLQTLAGTDVPIPRARWLEEDERWLGTEFYVMDRVDGRVPSDMPPMHVDGWVAELLPGEREALWWSGLEAMARVHRLDWRALGFGRLFAPRHGETPLEQQLDYYDEFFSWGMKRADFPLIESGLRYLRSHLPGNQPVSLCWGDSRLGNQIFQGQRCVAVLDWEMARLGSPVEDLAWWLATDRCFSEGIDAPRLPGFPDRAATVARWEELTGYRAQHLEYYEILALFRFSLIMSRVVQNLKRVGTIEPDDPYDRDNLASQILARALAEAGG